LINCKSISVPRILQVVRSLQCKMGGSRIRRELRRQCCAVTKILSTGRWITRASVRDVSKGLFGVRGGGCAKATEGAERSCHQRRRKRGLRKGKSRSRVGKTRPIDAIPAHASKPRITDRKVGRLLSQLEFWGKKRDFHYAKLKSAIKEGRLVQSKFNGKNFVNVPTSVYLTGLRHNHALNRKFLSAASAVRPFATRWSVLIDSFGGPLLPGQVPGWKALLELAEVPKEWLEVCEELEIDPTSKKSWDRYWSRPLPDKKRVKTRRDVAKAPPSKGAPSRLTRGKPNGKRERPLKFDKEPFQVNSGRKVSCSHCGKPAFSWANHRCAQAWRRQLTEG